MKKRLVLFILSSIVLAVNGAFGLTITNPSIGSIIDALVSVESGAQVNTVDSVFGRTGAVTAADNDYSWSQIDKTVSNITDITTRSHTGLTDIGSNTHTQIDGHISNTSNPHSVTATQIGVEEGADVTDPANVNSSGAVMESDFDATTFLYATIDDTPQPKTPAEVLTILGIESGATADQTAGEIESIVSHNNLQSLQGGTSSEYYHFTSAQHTDLTDSGDSSLHYHSSDRSRTNHTGTQDASTISDFDVEVGNHPDVSGNTAARHDAHSLDADDGDPANVVYVDADGNVGIGINTPDTKLHINDSSAILIIEDSDGDIGYNQTSITRDGYETKIGTRDDAGLPVSTDYTIESFSTGTYSHSWNLTSAGSETERMRLTNLGLGITDNTGTLPTQNTALINLVSNNPALRFYDSNGDVDEKIMYLGEYNGVIGLQLSNDAESAAGTILAGTRTGNTLDTLDIYATETTFHGQVYAGSTALDRLAIGTTITAGERGLEMNRDAVEDSFNLQSVYSGTGYEDLCLQPTGGNVGIGTSAPNTLLEVNPSSSGSGVRVNESDSTTIAASLYGYADGGELELYNAGSSSVKFSGTGGDNYISSSLGIGTQSPANGLHLEGGPVSTWGLRITPYDTVVDAAQSMGIVEFSTNDSSVTTNQIVAQIQGYSAGAYTIDSAPGELRFNTNDGSGTGTLQTRMTIDENGNVGIGTSSPSYLLHTYTSSAQVVGAFESTGNDPQIYVGDNMSSPTDNTFIIGYDRADNRGYFTVAGDPDSVFSVADGGNVGIGNTSPDKPLCLYASSNPAIRIQNPTTGTGWSDGVLIEANSSDLYVWNYEAGEIRLGTSATQRVTIDSSGKVGIGTNTPSDLLHVYSLGTSAQISAQSAGTDGYATLSLQNDGREWIWQVQGSDSDKLYLYDVTASSTRMVVDSSGNIRFNAYGAGTLVTDASGNITASSDASIKDVQGNIDYTLDQVAKLQGRVWKYTPESGLDTNSVYGGFVAQEVERIIPEAVHTIRYVKHPDEFDIYAEDVFENEDLKHKKSDFKLDKNGKKILKKAAWTEAVEGLRTLDDRVILAAYAGAFRDAKNRIEALEATVQEQAAMIQALSERISALEAANITQPIN